MSTTSYTYKGNRRGDDLTTIVSVPGTQKAAFVGEKIDLTEDQFGKLNVFYELEPNSGSDGEGSGEGEVKDEPKEKVSDPAASGASEQGSEPAVKTGPTAAPGGKMASDASSGSSR